MPMSVFTAANKLIWRYVKIYVKFKQVTVILRFQQ